MVKTRICKGDKVHIIKGIAASELVCTVIKVDRNKGTALVEMPQTKDKGKKKEAREERRKGVEVWKTMRYNPKTGEAGGLKIIKRPIHVSNLHVVEAAPKREFGK